MVLIIQCPIANAPVIAAGIRGPTRDWLDCRNPTCAVRCQPNRAWRCVLSLIVGAADLQLHARKDLRRAPFDVWPAEVGFQLFRLFTQRIKIPSSIHVHSLTVCVANAAETEVAGRRPGFFVADRPGSLFLLPPPFFFFLTFRFSSFSCPSDFQLFQLCTERIIIPNSIQ